MPITLKPILQYYPNKMGKHAIQIRITKDRKPTGAGINLWIEKDFWDEKASKVKARHPKSKLYNKVIQKRISDAEDFIHQYFLKQGTYPHPKEVSRFLKSASIDEDADEGAKQFEFISWASKYIDQKWPASKKRYLNEEYHRALGNLKAVQSKVYAFDLTKSLIKKLETYLKHTLADTTAGLRLSKIRTLVNEAVENDLISVDQNPFREVKIKSGKRKRDKPLSVQDLAQLQLIKPYSKEEELAIDFFLFSVYAAGARPGDVIFCDVNNIYMTMIDEVNPVTRQVKAVPRYYWEYNVRKVREKSPTVLKIVLTGKALDIYHKYGHKPKGFLFPWLPEGTPNIHNNKIRDAIKNIIQRNINAYLKQVGERMGLDFPLTTYCARHTFTALSAQNTSDKESRSKLLGHSTTAMTDYYPGGTYQEGLDKVIMQTWENV